MAECFGRVRRGTCCLILRSLLFTSSWDVAGMGRNLQLWRSPIWTLNRSCWPRYLALLCTWLGAMFIRFFPSCLWATALIRSKINLSFTSQQITKPISLVAVMYLIPTQLVPDVTVPALSLQLEICTAATHAFSGHQPCVNLISKSIRH